MSAYSDGAYRMSNGSRRSFINRWRGFAMVAPELGQCSSELSAIADGAEMLVDAEGDEDEFRGDARDQDAHQNADEAYHDQEQAAERVHRQHVKSGKDVGQPEQYRQADREPVEYLDDRRRDEAFPLEQVA